MRSLYQLSTRVQRLVTLLLISLLVGSIIPPVSAQSNVVYFPETGHYVGGQFLNFWNANGGMPIFGYPITPEYVAYSTGLITQYFERARFELLDLGGGQTTVQLGLLAVELTAGRTFPKVPPIQNTADRRYIPETQHIIQYGFKEIWERHGAERIFGFPISEEIEEVLQNGEWHTVQYFERSRFEYWPEFPPGERVLISHLGRMLVPPEMTAPVGTPPAGDQPVPPVQPETPAPDPAVPPVQPLPPSVNATVSPDSGPPGTTFTFSASGFDSREMVGLWLTTPDQAVLDAGLGQVRANRDGEISGDKLRIETTPDAPQGIWSFNARGITSNKEAIGYFRITTGPSTSVPPGDPARLGTIIHDQLPAQGNAFIVPLAAPSGMNFVFLSTGYQPGEGVEAWISHPDGSTTTVDPSIVLLDGDGALQIEIRTPRWPDGTYTIAARGQQSGILNSAAFRLTHDFIAGPGTPRPPNTNGTATPQEGGIGVVFQVRGSGLTPYEEVEVWITEPPGLYTLIPPGIFTADAQGNVGYEPPMDLTMTNEFAPGVYGIHFRGKSSGARVDVYFTYIVPGAASIHLPLPTTHPTTNALPASDLPSLLRVRWNHISTGIAPFCLPE